jgi:hypothetical protein
VRTLGLGEIGGEGGEGKGDRRFLGGGGDVMEYGREGKVFEFKNEVTGGGIAFRVAERLLYLS